MTKIGILLNFIEYLYYLFVGIGVVFAVIQYCLIKKDTKEKYNREVVSWTSELLRSFYKEILPKHEQLCRALQESQFYLPNDSIKIDIGENAMKERCENYVNSLMENNKNDMKDIAINIQILAVGLSYGNADTDMAKNVIGRKYLCIVETILPVIMVDTNVELYQECIELFNNWKYETKKAEHEKQAESLKEASKDLVVYNKNKV